jgi:hypothetical protein
MTSNWQEKLPEDDPIYSNKPHFVIENAPEQSTDDPSTATEAPGGAGAATPVYRLRDFPLGHLRCS